MSFANAATQWQERSLLIIKIDSKCNTGFGEASPLPGYSVESLESVQHALSKLPNNVSLPETPNDFFLLAKEFSQGLPSLRFALETAFLDLLSKEQSQSISKILNSTSKEASHGSILFDTSLTAEQNAKECTKENISCIKFKAPKIKEPAFIETLNKFNKCAPSVGIRIDANQSWTVPVAQFYCDQLANRPIEFIEEPCKTWEEAFTLKTNIPFACDESLHPHRDSSTRANEFLTSPKLKVAVLKPMVLGGIQVTMEHIKRLKTLNVLPILSHSLGGAAEHSMLSELACTMGSSLAHGLGNHSGLRGLEALVGATFSKKLIPSQIGLGLNSNIF